MEIESIAGVLVIDSLANVSPKSFSYSQRRRIIPLFKKKRGKGGIFHGSFRENGSEPLLQLPRKRGGRRKRLDKAQKSRM